MIWLWVAGGLGGLGGLLWLMSRMGWLQVLIEVISSAVDVVSDISFDDFDFDD